MSASNEKDLTGKFIAELEECLRNDDAENAVQLFKDEIHEQIIEESSWDVIPMVSSYLTKANATDKKTLFECCEVILNIIAEKCDPSETILQFLEQIESLEDDIKFCTMLKPIAISFNRMNDKSRAIEWCISTIQSYIQDLPLPESNKLDSNEDKITDEIDINLCRIENLYTSIISFVESLIQELNITNMTKQDHVLKDYILGLLIYLLGRPYCYLRENSLLGTKYHIKMLREKIFHQIFRLTKDLLYLLNFVDNRLKQENYTTLESDTCKEDVNAKQLKYEILESQKVVPNLAYANLYFYIITTDFLWVDLPQVYHPHYIFQSCIYFVNCLLQTQNTILIAKGLLFMEHLIKRVNKLSIGLNNLELKIYSTLLDTIINVMVYCDSDSERKKALSIFHEYINAFDMEARYFIIVHLYDTCNHSGVLSLVTSLLKTSIIESLGTPQCTYFSGSNLEALLKRACNLPHGSTTDIVEISDEIITTLNLLRFLLIRDQCNEIGIWNIISMLEENYLKPLRQGIDLCRAYWKTKVKDLEEEERTKNKLHGSSETEVDKEVTLSVGSEKLPAMPIAQKFKFSYQVLCGFRGLLTSRILVKYQSNNAAHQNTQHESSEKETEEEYEEKTKKSILTASLKFVPELGWSRQAISAGAESIGYPGIIHGMFPNGGAELVAYFYSTCNKELNRILKEKGEATEADPVKKKENPEEQVCYAIQIRLRMVIPYKKQWPQAIALMSLPPNVPTALANLITLVDDICYYTGDRSVDINWYTKRVVLAGIYKTTELYMLQDKSEDHKQTWRFLKSRIEDASQLHRLLSATTDLQQTEQALKRAKEIANATIITARNILGWNWYK
ncbi:hypothetical protein KPH14_010026 [Odynerus spinipes]|uniref:Ubiquinone biosynthesis protein n=1 Tax=Odynerus spinipes TaxID=1348599 RepID=A0AAD9VSI2_9HYME|nr:hypothetical protein KPH14_010026 [Odynerus spinipes]